MIKPLAAAAFLVALASSANAEPTRVMVRAQALDAKFIGDHMGGVQVTLRDARTGKVLARGLTKGGTGDTTKIMRTPRERGVALSDKDAAGFAAVLDLEQPTLVRAEAVGPVGKPGSSVRVTSSLWVIPGRDVAGDGWILTFPGLVVEPTVAPAADGTLKVTAKVTLMCGCPIEAGGLWDAANYRVEATLLKGATIVARTPLGFTGRPNEFDATTPPAAPGRYTLRLVATDAKTPNAGVAEDAIAIPPRRERQGEPEEPTRPSGLR